MIYMSRSEKSNYLKTHVHRKKAKHKKALGMADLYS